MESFRCAGCGETLSLPVRLVALPPAGAHWAQLDHHHVNPPLLEPGTYAIDDAPHGQDRVAGTFVLSPGDVRGTRIVPGLVDIGCWSLVGWTPCVACEGCGALVASRTDDCNVAQDTRFYPSMVVRESRGDAADDVPDQFAPIAGWDAAPPDIRRWGGTPRPVRPRPELTATRWGGRGVRNDLFRDDPPA